MKRILGVVLAMAMLLSLTGVVCAESEQPALQKDVVVLFTSDVHCGIDQGFGYAGLAAIRQSMEEAGNHVVLVDNGDSIQGEPIGTMTTGEALIELMNTVGYDLAIPGNHEFDYGMDRFLELTEKASFPYISANFNKDGELSTELFLWNNKTAAPDLLGIRNDVYTAVEAAQDALSEKLSEVVAKTAVELTINDPVATKDDGSPIRIVRRAETNLGDLCADAYRVLSGADIAFVNGGGIRTSIKEGDITLNDILKVHPFGNAMCVIEVTGQQILDALEWGARAVPSENGGFLQVSGLTYEIHTYIESTAKADENTMFAGVEGEYRVKNVMVGDEPLDLEKTYTLASHNYMLKNGGDGFSMFGGCKVLQDEVMLDNQVLINYITGVLDGVVGEAYANPYGEGRIVAVEEAPTA